MVLSNINISEDKDAVFIPYNVPSSKNSKIATSRGVFHSKTVQAYLKSLGIKSFSVTKQTIEYRKGVNNAFPIEALIKAFEGKSKPFVVGVHFVRNNARKFDFHNISQILFDLLVASSVIEDDNMDVVLPVPMLVDDKIYSIDKNNPGVYIKVFDLSISNYGEEI